MSRSTVEIECIVKIITERAVLINDGKRDVWIPISQISDWVGGDEIDTSIESIFIPEWLAIEKGLV